MRIRMKKEPIRRGSRNSKQVFLRIKNPLYPFLVAQELQSEWKKFFKISYTDNTLNIRGFQKRVTDEKLEELLASLKKQLEENNNILTRLNLNLNKFAIFQESFSQLFGLGPDY